MGPGFAVPYMIQRHTRQQGATPCKRSVHQSGCHLNVLAAARWRGVLTGLDDLGRGALLLREADRLFGVSGRLAECFDDYRDPGRTKHGLAVLVAQRMMGLALDYEDLNDHDRVRTDAPRRCAPRPGRPPPTPPIRPENAAASRSRRAHPEIALNEVLVRYAGWFASILAGADTGIIASVPIPALVRQC